MTKRQWEYAKEGWSRGANPNSSLIPEPVKVGAAIMVGTVMVPVIIGMVVADALTDHEKVRKKAEKRETRQLYEGVHAALAATPIAEVNPQDIAVTICKRALKEADWCPNGDYIGEIITMIDFLMWEEGLVGAPQLDLDMELSIEEAVAIRNYFRKQVRFLNNFDEYFTVWSEKVEKIIQGLLLYLPQELLDKDDGEIAAGDEMTFEMPLIDVVEDPAELVERLTVTCFDDDIRKRNLMEWTREWLNNKALRASGIEPEKRHTTNKNIIFPMELKGKTPSELVELYLGSSVFEPLLSFPVSFSLPHRTRFEHHHIVGGSGHGKTQLLQMLIHHDLMQAREGRGSIIVIDSQGDLINKIAHLSYFSPSDEKSLADKFMLIDPNDVLHPVALNMFDVNMERINSYDPVEREKILNGTIELYSYIFGALLGAELTQKQGVIFNYLAQLMLVIPNATVQTLMELMEDGEPFRPYMDRLDGTARKFFQSQFFNKSFNDTKQQILRRLWGVLSNRTFGRMFSNPHNKIDLFDAMNSGKIILINTARNLLNEEGCQIFGRFFIAMITQAAMQRAVIPEDRRRPTFLYVDEANEYFDEKIENILNQARKFKLGLVMSHQNLGQLSAKLKASVMASTSIKMAGGVSAKDARAFAEEMRCEPNFLQDMEKREGRGETDFACYIRNHTARPIKLTVPLGRFEKLPTMAKEEYEGLLAENRRRYCIDPEEPEEAPEKSGKGFELGEPELL